MTSTKGHTVVVKWPVVCLFKYNRHELGTPQPKLFSLVFAFYIRKQRNVHISLISISTVLTVVLIQTQELMYKCYPVTLFLKTIKTLTVLFWKIEMKYILMTIQFAI